jgi:ethanolamine ammonia-lyase small subunit
MTELRRHDRVDLLATARERTPARLFAGRAGTAYRTATHLELRRDHAAARDAVQAEVALADLPAELVSQLCMFEVATLAASKEEFLVRPDRGRRFSEAGRAEVLQRCPPKVDLQIAIGDGLSATAVVVQVPALLPLLLEGARSRGWKVGIPFLIHHCRVSVINEIGELLDPGVVVLLIGERPGLATAESLSAYMAYRPRPGDTDAKRNLISNIHARGISLAEAADRILNLAAQLIFGRESGVNVKETLRQLPEVFRPSSS